MTRLRAALAVLALVVAGCSAMPRLVSSDDLEARDRRILELEREVGLARADAASLRQQVAELERAAEVAAARSTAPEAPVSAAPAVETALAPPPVRIAVEESDLAEPTTDHAPTGDAAAYEAALEVLRAGRLEEAGRALRSFAESSPGSDLADNAWFWLGETRFAAGDTPGAIDAYRTAIDRYPEGNKIPDALLKLGVALAAAGQGTAAREIWSELVRRFPTTAAAEAAQVRLEAP